jgi:tetratricopeptide (TPR) repeat protein
LVSKNKKKITKSLNDALIFCQRGQLIEARSIYQKLIRAIPMNDQMLANFGTIELQMGNIEYAIELLEKSLLINPNQANILNNLGNYYLDRGDLESSINYFDKAISCDPKNSNAFYNKGRAMTSINKIDEAINCYRNSIEFSSENKMAHFNLGFIFNLVGQYDDAIFQYDEVINIDGKFVNAFFNRGISYANQKNHKKAIEDFTKAIDIESKANFIFSRAKSFEDLRKYTEAILDYSKIIALEPDINDKSLAYCRRARVKESIRDIDDGMLDIQTAINLDPKISEPYEVYAFFLKKLNRNEEARISFKKAIELDPENNQLLRNFSYLELALENYRNGWQLFESRWKVKDLKQIPLTSTKPKLKSFEVKNKKILIWCEQGLGDHILYSTMLVDALKTKNKFIVVIDKRLIDLYKRSFKGFENVCFLDRADNEDLYDFHLSIGSLGKFFRNSKQDFLKQKIPLLVSDEEYTEVLKNKIKSEKKYVCGISWMSKNLDFGNRKSMYLEDLQSLISLPDIDFVDLQYGDTKKEKKEFKDKFGHELIEMTEIDNFNDISKLAALINACDFVITTSNVTAHLAGALNKKTYLILPFTEGKIWYWGVNEDSSLWYPSIKIFRSEDFEDWKNPINNLIDLLSQEIIHERDN